MMARRRGLVRPGLWIAVAVASLSIGAASAAAEGGQSIAGATAVVLGQQEFGNLSNGAVTQNSCSNNVYAEWWTLAVTAGDQVRIDWESQQANTEMLVYPTGTTDFTYPQVTPLMTAFLNSNLKDQTTFAATTTGSMPVAFTTSSFTGCDSGTPGPYDFTAYIQHAVVLSVPPETSLPLTGAIGVGVHNPDGAPISDPSLGVLLQVQPSRQTWATVGSAAANAGAALIPYSFPAALAGQKVKIRVAAEGSAYVTAVSAPQSITLPALTRPPAPARCITPRLKGLKLGAAETRLRNAHCAVGRVRRPRHVRKHRVLHVEKQSPAPGSQHRVGYRVGLTLG